MRRIFAFVAVAALVVAACGGDDSSDVATLEDTGTAIASDTTAVDRVAQNEEAITKVVECFREEGLDVQDVTIDADGNIDLNSVFSQDVDFQSEAAQEAFETCAPMMENVDIGFDQLDLTALQDTLLQFAECVRENGFDLPDPDFSLATSEGVFGDVDFTDPAFEAALEACEGVLSQLPFEF